MAEYNVFTTALPTRWDEIAYKYYGNCFNALPIIQANPSIAIGAFIPKDTLVLVPVLDETTVADDDLPPWKE